MSVTVASPGFPPFALLPPEAKALEGYLQADHRRLEQRTHRSVSVTYGAWGSKHLGVIGQRATA